MAFSGSDELLLQPETPEKLSRWMTRNQEKAEIPSIADAMIEKNRRVDSAKKRHREKAERKRKKLRDNYSNINSG
jgi:hypothetical protein